MLAVIAAIALVVGGVSAGVVVSEQDQFATTQHQQLSVAAVPKTGDQDKTTGI